MADIRDLVFAPGRRGRRLHGLDASGARVHWRARDDGVWTRARTARRRKPLSSPWLLAVLVGVTLGLWGEPLLWPQDAPVEDAPAETTTAAFTLCHAGGGWNCVVDGDTFYAGGVKVRIAYIDTPETHPPRCAEEARLGEAATLRLQVLLGAGPFKLEPIGRDEDRYGRKLRVVMRDGESLGGTLVGEGLARWYGGGRRSWCPTGAG